MAKDQGPEHQYIYTEEGKTYQTISVNNYMENKNVEQTEFNCDCKCDSCCNEGLHSKCSNCCWCNCEISTCHLDEICCDCVRAKNGFECSMCNLLCWTDKDNYCSLDITFPLCFIPCFRCGCKS